MLLMQMPRKKSRKRIKAKGKYYRVRQRSTKKGKKGTILGKWKPEKKETPLEKQAKKMRKLVFGE